MISYGLAQKLRDLLKPKKKKKKSMISHNIKCNR